MRPVITGSAGEDSNQVIYVLERRSLFDLIVLDLVAKQLGLVDPLANFDDVSEKRRFFFLFRATGVRGKVTMYRFSERMQRIQAKLVDDSAPHVTLVPVSIYWGRTNAKVGSLTRGIVSDDWRASRGLRRALGLLFVRSDILVHIHRPIDWRSECVDSWSVPANLRHIARILRTTFKSERVAALGPVLVTRRAAIRQLASQGQDDSKQIVRRRKMAKRLVSNQSYPAMRVLKGVLNVFWRRVYDRVELLHVDRTHDLATTHTIIYLPNHRSHIDYLILSYLLFVRGIAIPHIAAGENLDLPILGGLLRRCGAFFMRRSYRDDPEYRALLADYVLLLLNAGHSIEFFIEGTRSRPGWTLEPRLGLLQMIVEIQEREPTRPIALVPVYTAYERLIESESYRAELLGESKRSESLSDAFSAVKLLSQRLGLLQVALGEPLELKELTTKSVGDSSHVRAVAARIVHAINNNAILSPTNLVATAMFSFGTGTVSTNQLAERIDFVRGLIRVESLKHSYTVSTDNSSGIVSHVGELGFYRIDDQQIILTNETLASLAWFRNNILHTLATPSIVAVVLLSQAEPTSRLEVIRQVAGLLPHVAAVLKFPMELRAVKRWLTHFRNAQLIREDNEALLEATPPNETSDADIRGLANLIMPVLECMYAMITCVITFEPYTLSSQELVERSFTLVRRVARARHADAMVSFDPRFFETFLNQLVRAGLIERDSDNTLGPSPRLIVIQRRSTVAIDSAFRRELQNHIDDER